MAKLSFLRQVIVWLLPWCIGSWSITLLIGPAFIRSYYTAPPVPVDPITTLPEADTRGLVPLTADEQLALALATVAFLESGQPLDVAAAQLSLVVLPHSGSPLYTARGLAHLRDVKLRTDFIRRLAWLTTLPVLVALLFLLRRPATRPVAFMALGRGGANAQVMLLGLAALILGGWPLFFYQFHGLFFPAGSWYFAPTDSLMRLFPEFFFVNWAVVWLGSTWLSSLLLSLLGLLLAGKRFANSEGGVRVANGVH